MAGAWHVGRCLPMLAFHALIAFSRTWHRACCQRLFLHAASGFLDLLATLLRTHTHTRAHAPHPTHLLHDGVVVHRCAGSGSSAGLADGARVALRRRRACGSWAGSKLIVIIEQERVNIAQAEQQAVWVLPCHSQRPGRAASLSMQCTTVVHILASIAEPPDMVAVEPVSGFPQNHQLAISAPFNALMSRDQSRDIHVTCLGCRDAGVGVLGEHKHSSLLQTARGGQREGRVEWPAS
jgi:hypothetical protein